MKNISFDNPYLLLVFIPLALAVIIPYVIAVSKDNKAFGWKASLGIHLVIAALVTLALAGIMSVTVLTKTTVYVVADVSYSSERNLDEIDEAIKKISESLPQNSELGIVCFGAEGNYIQLTPAGRSIKSVKDAKIDKSGTDIVSALNYTETLFKDGVIKRIILITDGNDTVSEDASSIAAAVDRLTDSGIKIDTVFLNNALGEGEYEIQLTGVDFKGSVFTDHESEAKFLINASADMDVMLELYSRAASDADGEWGEPIGYTVTAVQSGLSTIKMQLPTDVSDTFEYRAVVSTEQDASPYNNELTFTQRVEGRLNILLITGESADVTVIEAMYGDSAEIDSYVVSSKSKNVPFTLEELIEYDEYILSNVDIREINHRNAFIDALDIAVSQYGKSLIALGDLHMQEEAEDNMLDKLEELLPVSYGNSSRDGKLYTIVFDVSHSMFTASKYPLAKECAKRLLSLLNDEDYVCFITFSGKVTVRAPSLVKDCKKELVEYIDGLTTGHGTDIAMGLEEALVQIGNLNLAQNQVMLISDGFSFASVKSAEDAALDLYNAGTPVSSVNIFASSDGTAGRGTMQNVAELGGGKYYEITPASNNKNDVVFADVSNEVTEAIIDKDSTVNIARYKDEIADGFTSLPKVSTYIQSLAKFDATVPLTVNYEKRPNHVVAVPLYAYRSHGNGTVISFTSSLSGDWCSIWSDDVKRQFVENMLVSAAPAEKVDYPFTVKLDKDDFYAYLEITPSALSADAEVSLRLRYPDGQTKKLTLEFDSQKYSYVLPLESVGTYTVDITYKCDTLYAKAFETSVSVNVPYLPEYNAFASFNKATVYSFMHGKGAITEGDIPSLENDESEISKTKVRYTIPLLIAAISLFVIDIIVRKLRINKRLPKDKERRLAERLEKKERARLMREARKGGETNEA